VFLGNEEARQPSFGRVLAVTTRILIRVCVAVSAACDAVGFSIRGTELIPSDHAHFTPVSRSRSNLFSYSPRTPAVSNMATRINDGAIRVITRAMISYVSFAVLAMLFVSCDSPAAPGVSRASPPSVDSAGSARPSPAVTGTALVVESFTVIEYRPLCSWACPYLIYAPLIKLHEPTGRATVEVVSVEFTLGSRTTGVCWGSVVYGPGISAYLDGVYEYVWSNDLIFASLDGTPLPGAVATANVTTRAADGTFVKIEATGAVQRMVANPDFPAPRPNGWLCG
jgi:hypothetical protein